MIGASLVERAAAALKSFEDDMSGAILDGDFAKLRHRMALAVAKVILEEPPSEEMAKAFNREQDNIAYHERGHYDDEPGSIEWYSDCAVTAWSAMSAARLAEIEPKRADEGKA